MDPYDRSYGASDHLFGEAPEDSLLRFLPDLAPAHRHGDGPPERHARFEGVFRRAG